MSADLFAAFGDPQPKQSQLPASQSYANSQPPQNASTQKYDEQPWILQSRPLPHASDPSREEPLWKQDGTGANVLFDASDTEPNEDDFGDFEEVAADTTKLAQQPPPAHRTYGTNIDLLGLEEDLPVASSSHHPTTEASVWHDFDASKTQSFPSHRFGQHESSSLNSGMNRSQSMNATNLVHEDEPLAETASLEDEWGNFEDAQSDNHQQQQQQQQYSQPPTHTSHKSHKPAPVQPTKPPPQTQPDVDEDEDWDAFEDGPSEPNLHPTTTTTQKTTPDEPSTQTSSRSHPRPTTIPPPSTLLSLLPQIFSSLHQQSLPSSSPANRTLATQIQQTYTTTARLLAGRTLRWKRDQHLSQAFRISKAGVRSSGMKLTTLDRSASVKEDQDAAEAVAGWTRHAPALNAVLLKAKITKPGMSLAVDMKVRGAAGAGVLTAREACAVCGLKRNERVNGVDGNVDDTFGEFWVEFWGHRACYEFWYEYETLLDRR